MLVGGVVLPIIYSGIQNHKAQIVHLQAQVDSLTRLADYWMPVKAEIDSARADHERRKARTR
jgi:hypothetical protein